MPRNMAKACQISEVKKTHEVFWAFPFSFSVLKLLKLLADGQEM